MGGMPGGGMPGGGMPGGAPGGDEGPSVEEVSLSEDWCTSQLTYVVRLTNCILTLAEMCTHL